MSKLPQDVRLQIARNTAQDVWEMSELLGVIRKEVEAREISDGIKVTPEKPKVAPPKPLIHGSAAALLANGQTLKITFNVCIALAIIFLPLVPKPVTFMPD